MRTVCCCQGFYLHRGSCNDDQLLWSLVVALWWLMVVVQLVVICDCLHKQSMELLWGSLLVVLLFWRPWRWWLCLPRKSPKASSSDIQTYALCSIGLTSEDGCVPQDNFHWYSDICSLKDRSDPPSQPNVPMCRLLPRRGLPRGKVGIPKSFIHIFHVSSRMKKFLCW